MLRQTPFSRFTSSRFTSSVSRRFLKLALLTAAAILADSVTACAQDPPPTPLAGGGLVPGTAWVIFGADTVVVEVAATPEERSRGLSNREEVPPGTGMLFLFERTEERTFWMRDTLVDLDIAFFDEDYQVLEILQMEAETLDLHDSSVPVFMALEVPGGWFAEHAVAVGSVAEIVFGPTP